MKRKQLSDIEQFQLEMEKIAQEELEQKKREFYPVAAANAESSLRRAFYEEDKFLLVNLEIVRGRQNVYKEGDFLIATIGYHCSVQVKDDNSQTTGYAAVTVSSNPETQTHVEMSSVGLDAWI